MVTRGRSLAIAILLITTGAVGDSLVWAQSRVPSSPRIPAAVAAHARGRGSVRVIAALNVAFTNESLLGVSGVQSQRASIARAQSGVLSRILRTRPASIRRFRSIPYLALEVDEADLQLLAASPEVTNIQIDAVAAPSLAESTPLIGATRAWAAGYTGAGSTVAIVDTGVDSSHPFLAGRVVSEACFSSTVAGQSDSMCPSFTNTGTLPGSGGPCLLPGCEHGTHVAGIAAGKGEAFSGVAPDATIISIQVFSSFSAQEDCGTTRPAPCLLSYTSDQILALERVYALRSTYDIAAVNLSLGGGLFSSPCDSNPLKAIVDQLRTAGIATVIASGNDYSTTELSAPACISTAVSVGSTTDGSFLAADHVSLFSNTNQYLSLLAPGQTIYSSAPGGRFMNLSGTSMAAPHVTGAWALMKSKRPSASVSDILNAFVASGTPITDSGNGLVFSRINVDAALAMLPSVCEYAVSPSRISVGAQAGAFTIAVTAPVNCRWSATSASPFTTVPNGESRVGSGNVVVSYAASSSPESRTTLVTIADTTVTILQRGIRPVHGDINGDGRADIVLQNLANGSLTTWWLDGWNVIGTSSPGIPQVSDTNWRVVGSGDLNGDGNTDLVWRHRTDGWVGVWYLVGTSVVSTQYLSINRVADSNWEIKGVGDIDGDGKADLIWQHRTEGSIGAWLMNGERVVATRSLSIGQIPDHDWQIVGVGDVDADGYADLLWQHQTEGSVGVWRMRGTDVITTQLLSIDRIADTNWHIRGVGDVDGDNHADLIWQNDETGELGVWLLNGSLVLTVHDLSTNTAPDLNWRVVGPG